MKKILVIEDEEAFLEILIKKLSNEGFEIESAKDGIVGLSKAIEIRPDLIILDIALPKMDGMDVLKNLRMNEWGEHAKVIVLTNLNPGSGADLTDVMKHKPDHFFVKVETSLDKLINKAKELLD